MKKDILIIIFGGMFAWVFVASSIAVILSIQNRELIKKQIKVNEAQIQFNKSVINFNEEIIKK